MYCVLCVLYVLCTVCTVCTVCNIYRIAGNFGEVFNLANWQFYGISPNLKIRHILSDDAVICHAAKFKTHQIVL